MAALALCALPAASGAESPLRLAQTPPPPESGPRKEPANYSARPRSGVADEAAYRAALDKAIAPVLNRAVSDDDMAALKSAFAAIGKGRTAEADGIRAGVKDPVVRKMIVWYALARGDGKPAEYRDFLAANPTWPQQGLLQQRMEEALFAGGGNPQSVKSFFKDKAPETAIGEAALAAAHLAAGEKEAERKLAAKAWRDGDIPASIEPAFLARFKPLLTEADHRWRLDRILLGDRRWSASRRARAEIAMRVIPLLSAGERKKAEARLAVYLRSSSAAKLMGAFSLKPEEDWGFAYQRLQLLRRKDRSGEAIKILLAAPTDPAKIVSPDDWWEERRANAYEALENDNFKLAYELVRDAGPLTVNPLKEQRFMAGWIAMRYMKNATLAEKHFRAMREAADGPLSRSRVTTGSDARSRRRAARRMREPSTRRRRRNATRSTPCSLSMS
ncbi:MAG: hypothetical protein AB7L18_12925 [Hyphomicrobiaceae bacterium]